MSNTPKWIKWRNRIYKITKIGFHYTYSQGQTLLHIFSVICDTTFMKIRFNTKSLNWVLEEIENGI